MIRSRTDPRWLEVALADFDALLIDHAHCEKKAAGAAMALVTRYPDREAIVRSLVPLAIEELGHFRWVYGRLRERGLVLKPDRGDPYARELHRLVSTDERRRRVDLLLVAGLIEARSCERLGLLASALTGRDRDLYARLAKAERGHAMLFEKLARECADGVSVEDRLVELGEREAEVVARLPIEPRVH